MTYLEWMAQNNTRLYEMYEEEIRAKDRVDNVVRHIDKQMSDIQKIAIANQWDHKPTKLEDIGQDITFVGIIDDDWQVKIEGKIAEQKAQKNDVD